MCFEGIARLSRRVWRRFVRGSREISLVPSLHRASTDALIYLPLLILTCESRRVRSCARMRRASHGPTGTRAVETESRKILGKIAVATDRSLACYCGYLTDREMKPSNVSFYARWSNVLIILAPQIRRDCEALLWAYSALLFVLLCSAVSSYKYTHSVYVLLQVVILVVLSCSSRRKNLCLECCNGRPGLYS